MSDQHCFFVDFFNASPQQWIADSPKLSRLKSEITGFAINPCIQNTISRPRSRPFINNLSLDSSLSHTITTTPTTSPPTHKPKQSRHSQHCARCLLKSQSETNTPSAMATATNTARMRYVSSPLFPLSLFPPYPIPNFSNTTNTPQHDAKCAPKSAKSQAALAKEQTKLFRELSPNSRLGFVLTKAIQSNRRTIWKLIMKLLRLFSLWVRVVIRRSEKRSTTGWRQGLWSFWTRSFWIWGLVGELACAFWSNTCLR